MLQSQGAEGTSGRAVAGCQPRVGEMKASTASLLPIGYPRRAFAPVRKGSRSALIPPNFIPHDEAETHLVACVCRKSFAEEVGFEPTAPLRARRFSKPLP